MSIEQNSRTGTYKDMEIPSELVGIINYMNEVEGYREELTTLGQQWDLLTILGQMSGTGTDMTGTRQGFQTLTSRLLSSLGTETLKKSVQEMASTAQVAVDIVIRNLFERTADIGFLATDDDIRDFLRRVAQESDATPSDLQGDLQDDHSGGTHGQPTENIVARFQEYVDKYSVYYNIILLDTEGKIVGQLDQTNAITQSSDPMILEALQTGGEYVETFRYSDLQPNNESSLIYAYRVTETNDATSSALGVLCLCFKFEDEMEGVFRHLIGADDWSVIMILDEAGKVIASSDQYHIPLGAQMELAIEENYKIAKFAGRQYLAKTCPTKGYQGFMGLGWYGHVMLPLERAFDDTGTSSLESVDAHILAAVMGDPRLFSEELRRIPVDAESIQKELDRTVWNGNVLKDNGVSQSVTTAAAKVLLWEISTTGGKTKSVFERSIGNLHETVVSSILHDVQFFASLAIDIMDRNLYERANDCRWWALTSVFRMILSKPEISDEDRRRMADILAYINGLYTVYTNLFVYDRSGTIVAVSQSAEGHIVNRGLNEEWARQILTITNSQQYGVSPFEPTDLYGGRPTYIYGASFTAPNNPRFVVGGIGIVFDSEPEFAAMLLDSLPRDEKGNLLPGCFGLFANRNRTIISSTDQDHPVGEKLTMDDAFFALPNGEGMTKIIEYNGHYYAVGASASNGYREYKNDADDYENDVVAMVFVLLGSIAENALNLPKRKEVAMQMAHRRQASTEDVIEIASFYIGDKWLGINAEHVVEATSVEGITTIPGASAYLIGTVLFRDTVIPVIDARHHLGISTPHDPQNAQIVVAKTDTGWIGILVDLLGEIPEVSLSRVEKDNPLLALDNGYTDSIIKPSNKDPNDQMLVVLNPQKLLDYVVGKGFSEGQEQALSEVLNDSVEEVA